MNRFFTSLLAASIIIPYHAVLATHEPAAQMPTSRASSPADLLTELSTCALSCLIEHSPTFGCSVTDIQCQCESEPLYDVLSTCMVMNCTLEEAVGLAKVDAEQCNRPKDSLNDEFLTVHWISSIFVYGSFGLRIISRAFVTKQLWWDDFFHTIAIGFAMPITYGVRELARLGFGRHLFQVEASSLNTFWMWYFISQLLWASGILALKVSVMCLYLRLFPSKRFLIACYTTMGITVAGAIAFLLVDLLQCSPISAGWKLQRGDAECLSFSIIAIGSAVFNVLSEIAIFLLPMPILITLNLKLWKKIQIILLLGLGLITILVASIRIPSLRTLDGYSDPTYRTYPAYLWTALELIVAHICVSAPAISVLFSSMNKSMRTVVQRSNYLSYGKDGGTKHGSNSTGDKPLPRLPPRRDVEDGYDDEVELQRTRTSSHIELNSDLVGRAR